MTLRILKNVGSAAVRSVQCVVIALGTASLVGCYTYSRVTSEPTPGMDVRLSSTRVQQSVTLHNAADSVRVTGVSEVYGSVLTNSPSELTLRLASIKVNSSSNLQPVVRGMTTSIARSGDGRFDAPFVVSKRQLSAGRTALLFGGFALGAMTVSVLSATHKDFGNCC